MRAAAREGCRDFDLWGIAPPSSDSFHPWYGLGLFKAGFGGRSLEYVGAWDLVFSRLFGGITYAPSHGDDGEAGR